MCNFFFEVGLTTTFCGVKYRFVALESTRADVSGVGMSKSGCKTWNGRTVLSRKRLSASVCEVARCIFIFACVVLLFRYPRYERFQYLGAGKRIQSWKSRSLISFTRQNSSLSFFDHRYNAQSSEISLQRTIVYIFADFYAFARNLKDIKMHRIIK